MENQEHKTHWKKLVNPDYIGAYTLMETGKAVDLTVTIVSVGREIVKGEGGKKEECTVAKLKGHKPFIVNRTNAKTISKIHGSPFIEDWAGKQITLYVANVAVAGEQVEALRVRPTKPQLPVLNPESPRWEGAKKSLHTGAVTMEQLLANFTISEAHQTELLKP